MHSEYQYVASIHRAGQRSALSQVPLDVDWGPAEECVRLAVLRHRCDPRQALSAGEVFAEPLWHREAGEPYLAGLRVGIQVDGEWITEELDSDYFLPAVLQAAGRLVESGALQDGQDFTFLVLAFFQEGKDRPPVGATDRDDGEAPPPWTIHATDFETLLRASTPLGLNDPDDMPVFVPAAVLDEIMEHTRSAGAAQTGGILIGRMHRDPLDSQMLFFEVTAQVPAVHGVAVSEQDRFAFPPEIWTAVQAAIRLRGRGEIRGGWWHSHPAFAFCEDCPPDRRAHCPWRDPNGFFSDADRVLHRGAFVRAYHVGLVATHIDGDVWLAGFGWRKGQIVRRGLRVIGARRGYEPGGARGCLVSGDMPNGTPCK